MDEWLQLLSQHPIFDGSKTTATASAVNRRERVAIRGSDLFAAVGQEIRWIDLKACKDAHVKSESKRIKGQSGVTANALDVVKSVPWYKLGCDTLSFDIDVLRCNSNGKLLVAAGKHQVAVIVLPLPGSGTKTPAHSSATSGVGAFSIAREKEQQEDGEQGLWVDCRSMLLATTTSKDTTKARRRSSVSVSANKASARARVVDVLWHPMSTSDSHLLVLQANGVVKIFDVSEDVDTPEQTLSLFGTSGSFSMAQAVSFCLGTPVSAAGWQRVTLYVLTATGELYSMCPVLPRKCCVGREWMESLLEAAQMDVREWQAEEYETSGFIYTPTELIDSRAAVKWLVSVLGVDQTTSGKKRLETSSQIYLTLSGDAMQPAAAQGPYLFQPDPISTSSASDGSAYDSDDYECDGDDACDVLYMESKGGTGLMAISYMDGHVELFADLLPVIGRWVDFGCQPAARDLPTLVTLASVDLAVQPLSLDVSANEGERRCGNGVVSLMGDTLDPTVFYALHKCGVHRVDMSRWAQLLDMSLEHEVAANDGLGQILDKLLEINGNESVGCVVHTRPSADTPAIPVIGAVVIDDIYLSYSLLTVLVPCKLAGVSLPLCSEDNSDQQQQSVDDDDKEGRNGSRRHLDIAGGAKDVVYVPRLPKGGYTIPPSLTGMQQQQPHLVLNDDRAAAVIEESREFSEPELKLLGEVVGPLRGQLETLVSAHATMRTHLDLEVQEHKRQHDKLTAISCGFWRHYEQMEKAQKRMDHLRYNGQRLSLRVDQILRQLISHYQPELTTSERAFVRGVHEMDVKVNGPGGYGRLVDKLQVKVKNMEGQVKESGKAVRTATTSSSSQLSEEAVKDLEQRLEHEQGNLTDTCKRISELREQLDHISL